MEFLILTDILLTPSGFECPDEQSRHHNTDLDARASGALSRSRRPICLGTLSIVDTSVDELCPTHPVCIQSLVLHIMEMLGFNTSQGGRESSGLESVTGRRTRRFDRDCFHRSAIVVAGAAQRNQWSSADETQWSRRQVNA